MGNNMDLNYEMFCYQCEQTANGKGCTKMGVCGKTPELVAGLDGYWVSMYTYDNGTVYTVMDQWGYGAMGNVGYSYFPKKNILVNYNSDFAGAVSYTYYGKMKNHELVDYYKKTLMISCFVDKNGNGFPDEDEFLEDENLYYYGDTEISAEKYESLLITGDTKNIIGKYSAKRIKKKLK